MDRKKELKKQYLETKPEMGILIIRSNSSNKCCIEKTKNLIGTMNGARFKLNSGGYPNRELQKDWSALGEENFTIAVLDRLEYDKDESKTDYTDDLTLLQSIWEEKLLERNLDFYKR